MNKTPLGSAIRAAVSEKRKEEGELASIEESNNDSKIVNDKDSKIQSDKAIQLQKEQDSKIESDKTSEAQETVPPVELVGLNIRVPKSHRLHWLIAAKKEGTTLTAAVNEGLAARYGLPDTE